MVLGPVDAFAESLPVLEAASVIYRNVIGALNEMPDRVQKICTVTAHACYMQFPRI
jgi:hypothetical protein